MEKKSNVPIVLTTTIRHTFLYNKHGHHHAHGPSCPCSNIRNSFLSPSLPLMAFFIDIKLADPASTVMVTPITKILDDCHIESANLEPATGCCCTALF
jgi:hypothetical protein